ncbi:MAG: phosphotransferase family protein, partial [Nitrospiria bacterium]
SPLSEQQREKVWSISCDGMREMSDLIQEKLRAIVDQSDLDEISRLEPVQSGKVDPTYRVFFANGRCCFIKYAGDTVEAGCFGQKLIQKPRRRLSTERRALKRLREHHLDTEVDLPEVVFFDKKTLTLILSAVCAGGRSLLDDLKHGRFDPAVAGTATSFLAGCHALSSPVNPVWGDHETDLTHWEKMLDLRTGGIKSESFSKQVRQSLEALKHLSIEASKKRDRAQLLILDYVPKNILLGKRRMGVIDFERCSTIGDPAFDFGLFLGNIIFWGLVTNSGNACRSAIETSLKVYQERFGKEWFSCRARVAAFSGVALLVQMREEGTLITQRIDKTLMKTAETLLSRGRCQDEEIDEIMIRAASGQLVIGSS